MLEHLIAWLRRQPLSAPLPAQIDALPAPLPLADAGALATARLVVADLETSGLNPNRDIVLAIGAVAIVQRQIRVADQFEAILAQPSAKPGESLLIHGLGPDALGRGVEPASALLSFLEWAGPTVFVAFHAPFDRIMFRRALRRHLNLDRRDTWIDLADILPALFPEAKVGAGHLDDWLAYFRLRVSDRHNAAADAWITAELMLVAMREAQRQGILTLPELEKKARLARQLRKQRHRF